MTKTNKWIVRYAAAAIGTAVAFSSGCQQEARTHGEEFPADGAPRSVNTLFEAQAASGARADSTLYACHFDGDSLNSLGTSKLDLMLKDDDATNPMTVYLAVPSDAHRDSITRYLKDHGLLADQIKFMDGTNPTATSDATDGLKNRSKTETGSSVEGGSSGSSSGATDSGSAAGTSGGMTSK